MTTDADVRAETQREIEEIGRIIDQARGHANNGHSFSYGDCTDSAYHFRLALADICDVLARLVAQLQEQSK